MKFEIYIERKAQTYPYENVTVGLSEEFDDSETPLEAGFISVRDKLNEWIEGEVRRLGPKSPEPREKVLISPSMRRPRDPLLDLSDEPAMRRRFR